LRLTARLVTVSSFLSPSPTPSHTHTLSLHDALPISKRADTGHWHPGGTRRDAVQLHEQRGCAGPAHARCPSDRQAPVAAPRQGLDRKSTRLNSSHVSISYAVFCLKKKIKHQQDYVRQ